MQPKDNAKLPGLPTTQEELEKAAAKYHLSVDAYKIYLEARMKAGSKAGVLDRQMRDIFGKHGALIKRLGK